MPFRKRLHPEGEGTETTDSDSPLRDEVADDENETDTADTSADTEAETPADVE